MEQSFKKKKNSLKFQSSQCSRTSQTRAHLGGFRVLTKVFLFMNSPLKMLFCSTTLKQMLCCTKVRNKHDFISTTDIPDHSQVINKYTLVTSYNI